MKKIFFMSGILILVAAVAIPALPPASAGEPEDWPPEVPEGWPEQEEVIGGVDGYIRKMTPEEVERLAPKIKARVDYSSEHSLPKLLEKLKANDVVTDDPRVAKAEDVGILSVPSENLIEIENMDWDLAPEDGFAVDEDEKDEAYTNYDELNYDLSTDLDGDGYTTYPEYEIWDENYEDGEPGELSDIYTDLVYSWRELDWPSHPWNWECSLWGCDFYGSGDYIEEFIGKDSNPIGWINVHLHEYESGEYVCRHFSADTATCAHKAIGYGFFPIGYHHGDPGHTYQIFLKDNGDWTDLSDWAIVKDQNGDILSNAASVSTSYQTDEILFPVEAYEQSGSLRLDCAVLAVDYDGGTVEYTDDCYTLVQLSNCEEMDEMEFDGFLS